jgi:hypothetical protein
MKVVSAAESAMYASQSGRYTYEEGANLPENILTGRDCNMGQELVQLLMQPVRNSFRTVNRRASANTDDGIDRRIFLDPISGLVKLFDRCMLADLRESASMVLGAKKLLHLLDQRRLVREGGASDYESFRRFRG